VVDKDETLADDPGCGGKLGEHMGIREFVLESHRANEWKVGGSGLLGKCRGHRTHLHDGRQIGLTELSLKFVFRTNRKRDDPSNLRLASTGTTLSKYTSNILRNYHQHLLATCRLGLGIIHWHHCCQAGSWNFVVFSFNKQWGHKVS
jgi:hypothetical protein